MAENLNPRTVLLDTDILSHLMRREPRLVANAREQSNAGTKLAISEITRYEILSGLKARRATRRIEDFRRMQRTIPVLPLTSEVIETASDIKADLLQRGELIQDPDTLIAATALVNDLVVVTNNERHFRCIPNLVVENWLR